MRYILTITVDVLNEHAVIARAKETGPETPPETIEAALSVESKRA